MNEIDEEWIEHKYFDIDLCKEEFFVKTELEKEFWA